MIYREKKPSEVLQHIVSKYWNFQVTGDGNKNLPINHETLPESTLSIVLIQNPYFEGVRILGPHSVKFKQQVFLGSRFLGIALHPWLIFTPKIADKKELLNKTASASNEIIENLNYLLSKEFSLTIEFLPILEEALLTLFSRYKLEENKMIKYICLQLDKERRIKDITEELPFSIRVIQKKFLEVTGLTMKQYSYNNRQRRIWEQFLEGSKSEHEIILDHQYYDQAHFINEFKRKMQRSHADFKNYLQQINISLSN